MAEIHVCESHDCGVYICAGCKRACGWCFGAADDFYDYCDDCWAAMAGGAVPRTSDGSLRAIHCIHCGKVAQGNYSIHLTETMSGPDVPLCDECGENEDPSCPEIWQRIKEFGFVKLKQKRPDAPPNQKALRSYDPNDDSMFDIED